MKREELRELHYITRIANLPSIMKNGILSFNRVRRAQHESFALDEAQRERARKTIPGGRRVHDCACLYIWARNATLFRVVREGRAPLDDLCVLRLHPSVLDLPGVVVSDRNAASWIVRFGTPDDMLPRLDRSRIMAKYWLHEDPVEQKRHRAEMCAEVLVPEPITPSYIRGAIVPNRAAEANLRRASTSLKIRIVPNFFFPEQ